MYFTPSEKEAIYKFEQFITNDRKGYTLMYTEDGLPIGLSKVKWDGFKASFRLLRIVILDPNDPDGVDTWAEHYETNDASEGLFKTMASGDMKQIAGTLQFNLQNKSNARRTIMHYFHLYRNLQDVPQN